MGKAHEANVQRDPIESRREPHQLMPDGGDSPESSFAAKHNTNLEQGSSGPSRIVTHVEGPDVQGVHQVPIDERNTKAVPDDTRLTEAKRADLQKAADRDKADKQNR